MHPLDETSKIQPATADNREFTQRSTTEGFDNGVRDWKKLGRRPHTVDCQVTLRNNIRELKQPRRRRQQKPHKFAYLTMKNSIFACFARAFLIFDILKTFLFFLRREMTCFSVVWTTWACWHMFNFVFLCPKRWFQINSRTVRRHFSSVMTLNNWKMIAEKRSYIFRWRSRFRRRRVCLSSLIWLSGRRSVLLARNA